MIERLRAVKDAGELAVMRDAAALISHVFDDVVRSIKPGVTELDLPLRTSIRT